MALFRVHLIRLVKQEAFIDVEENDVIDAHASAVGKAIDGEGKWEDVSVVYEPLDLAGGYEITDIDE